MRRLDNLSLLLLLALVPGAVRSQAPPPPPLPMSPGASVLDRINREDDALARRTEALATLRLAYRSSGDLSSTLQKTNPQSLFFRLKVNGSPVKGLARGNKPKLERGVEPGPMEITAHWTRPGIKVQTGCSAELDVGMREILFLPYGGSDNFSCEVVPLLLAPEEMETWKATFEEDQISRFEECSAAHATSDAAFWSCIDSAGLPFPQV